jgi:DNA-directed RNA polymerase subunit RPC12/RpoP
MYIKQVIGSLAASLGAGYLSLASGYTGIAVVAAAILAYSLVRWVWATYHRTGYWLSRGTEGVHTEYCPNCERSRYRMSGDWILQCHKCGWKPGLPVLRWMFRSLPANQFRRSVSRIEAFVMGISIPVLLSSGEGSAGAPSSTGPIVSIPVPQLPGTDKLAIYGLVVLLFVGTILWAQMPRQYYCENCGQDLGRGDPPETCPKCGSNRFTNEDPGVGEKVRIEEIK